MVSARIPNTKPVESDAETRARLLHAAGEVFAKRGFEAATVREICALAAANVAAVNYHFRSKDALYRETFEAFARSAFEKYPPTLSAPADAAPEERLHSFVLALLLRTLDENQPEWGGALMMREFVQPTTVLFEITESYIKPMIHLLRSIVRDLYRNSAKGVDPTVKELRYITNSVLGQCVFYRHARPMIGHVMPEQKYDRAALEELAQHITGFSLAAISLLAQSQKSRTPRIRRSK